MKFLVIGGAGYIGSHVVKYLIKNNHQATVFDNLSSGYKDNIFKGADFIEGDILNYQQLLNTMEQSFDVVIHLAGKKAVGESMENPAKYSINNLKGTINIINAMLEKNIKNIIFSSSAAVYGMPDYLPIDEKHPINPINFYGFTKADAENYFNWYSKLKDFHFVSLRYFNAVGYDAEGDITIPETNPQNLLPIVMEVACKKREKLNIFGNDYDTPDGTCVRDYIHVTDLADAHLKAAEYLASNQQSQIINLGTSKGVSVLEMLKKSIEITQKDIKYDFAPRRSGDPASLTASTNKAKEVLGWQAKHSDIDNIIKTTWNIYKKEPF